MTINYEIYRMIALETCKRVFIDEYNRSLGIPIPKIEFVLPDSRNYKSGEYYISIGDNWQIHLNFGFLPKSYKDFQEEVRVLTRHEIEHYMCCPYDVLTHLRMLKAIIDTYHRHYNHHILDIISISRSIANQAADIIIDTLNFHRYKSDTLKSEIAWIKKGSNKIFKDLPRHSKLMFLVKEAIWQENLQLFEEDNELLSEVKSLAEKFEIEGIENRNHFLAKTVEYTHAFFRLFEQDQNDEISQKNLGENNNLSSVIPQILPSKDSQENGSQFIFQTPDKIKEALTQLALESTLNQFSQILSAAGISSLNEIEKQKIWFEAQHIDMIPIIEHLHMGSNDNYSYPTIWKLGDPMEDIDMMLTFSTSPIIIPGVTTKKWIQNQTYKTGSERKDTDLFLIVDTSGSMGSVTESYTNLHQSVLASFGIIKYFESKKNQIALIGFSDKITVYSDWSQDYDHIRYQLLTNGSGGTNFPIERIKSMIDSSKNPLVTVIFTDGELQNKSHAIEYFKDYLTDGNKLFIFLQDNKTVITDYISLKNFGAKVIRSKIAREMRDLVLNEVF